MEYCSYCNIVHDLRSCPLCTTIEEITAVEKQLNTANDKIAGLEDELNARDAEE